ncbi:uncharacterized protein FA14DRAFT_174390 [Meira miltonrushii]|uniref:DUF1772-domain-containing protein n=1 Tax=Meira miltonrushii TaxID=1280837 RepID=A0A316V547_9BASI|nr:uncharacterized protein FA14DRAFT_174390 [Meira miltonrushii]PWN32699.1 hypothetical protein FA14DRAFT_174390 [Meira miltonrushii]
MSDLSHAVNHALSNVTPYRFLTGAGIGFSSLFFFANVGANVFGLMPLISNPALRKEYGIPIESAVRQWDWFFAKAMPWFAASASLASASFLLASFRVPKVLDQRLSSNAKLVLRIATAFAVLPLPYTITMLKPTNDALMALAAKSGSFTALEASTAGELLQKWFARHLIRTGLYGVTLALGVLSSLIV